MKQKTSNDMNFNNMQLASIILIILAIWFSFSFHFFWCSFMARHFVYYLQTKTTTTVTTKTSRTEKPAKVSNVDISKTFFDFVFIFHFNYHIAFLYFHKLLINYYTDITKSIISIMYNANLISLNLVVINIG